MTEGRPAIGIVTSLERAQYGVWDTQAALLPFLYVSAIQRAGGLAVMIPPDAQLAENPDEMLDQLDGLLLAGGSDIDPGSYGQERHPETKGMVPERDTVEIALATRAMERDMPILGICRGMQLLNVAAGGTLLQHLPDIVGHTEHRRSLGSFEDNDHDVTLDPGSLAARAAGESLHVTKSHHHQGLDEIGECFIVTGRSTMDKLPEAIEDPRKQYVLGVQWHPEADETSQVVASLVDEARAYRKTRGSL